jgi:hypothetical protein
VLQKLALAVVVGNPLMDQVFLISRNEELFEISLTNPHQVDRSMLLSAGAAAVGFPTSSFPW